MTKAYSIVLSSFILLLTVAHQASAASDLVDRKVVIELPASYTISKATQRVVRLGEIAVSLTAPDAATKKQYESLIVLDAPDAGKTTRLPNHYIIQSIRKAGMNFTNVHFTGERLVEVLGFGKEIDMQTILQKMKSQILADSGWSEEELVLRVLSAPTNGVRVPNDNYEIVMDRVSPVYYGTVRYEVRLFIDSIQYKNFPVVASVSHRRMAYKPARTLQRGDVIGPNDIREVVQYFENVLTDQQAVDDPKEIVGSKCRTPLTKGDVIKWNNLEVNYVVNRGDLVKLVIQNKGISMQTTGKALKRGAIGDIVLVKAADTNYTVKARVIQRGLVELVSI